METFKYHTLQYFFCNMMETIGDFPNSFFSVCLTHELRKKKQLHV